MFRLSNAVRGYAWGSETRLAEFLGRTPSGGPEAELWIGAHEGDPSRLPDGRSLGDAIADHPQEMVGGRVCDIFGDRLPFLMKVLAVDEPLSLQVHPSSARARAGHARENEQDVPVDAPHRSYKDQWHKPELIFALSRFEGMAGFRDVPGTVELLAVAHIDPEKVRWAEELRQRDPVDLAAFDGWCDGRDLGERGIGCLAVDRHGAAFALPDHAAALDADRNGVEPDDRAEGDARRSALVGHADHCAFV